MKEKIDKSIWQKLFPLLLAMCLVHANAGESLAYFCEVKAVAEVSKDGAIREIKKGQRHLFAEYLGSKFKVVKATGEIDGPIVSNKTPNVLRTTVIDEGGPLQSYKVLSIFGPSTSILYIQINDSELLSSDKGRYTFSGFRWQEFITGTCF